MVESSGWTDELRVYGEYGALTGDITCTPDQASQPPGSAGNPTGCLGPSRDRFSIALCGLEVQASRRWWPGGPASYAGVAVNAMHLRLAADVLETSGLDCTTLYTHGQTVSPTVDLVLEIISGVRLTGEVFYLPLLVERPGGTEQDGLITGRARVSIAF